MEYLLRVAVRFSTRESFSTLFGLTGKPPGEQGWFSNESTYTFHWCDLGLISGLSVVWVGFVVDSGPCFKVFSLSSQGSLVLSPFSKTNISKFQFHLVFEGWRFVSCRTVKFHQVNLFLFYLASWDFPCKHFCSVRLHDRLHVPVILSCILSFDNNLSV